MTAKLRLKYGKDDLKYRLNFLEIMSFFAIKNAYELFLIAGTGMVLSLNETELIQTGWSVGTRS